MNEELIDLLSKLVSTDSVNPSLVPGAAGEGAIAGVVADWLRVRGIGAVLDEAAPGRLSVIARVPGTGGGPALMLNAHLDTVGVAGMAWPFRPRVEGHRLYGRGSYDMKGSLAACLLALQDAQTAQLRGDVILCAVADEEHASLGMASVLRRLKSEGTQIGAASGIGAAIVTEPTGLQVCVAHKGFSWHEVTTHGRAAHGSRPDLGRDAIAHMGRVLGQLEAWQHELAARPAHPLLGHASVHASLISGGQELSSYPERCTLQIERRTLPGEEVQQIEAELDALLGSLSSDPAFQVQHRTLLARAPYSVPADAEIVQTLVQQAGQVLGQAPTLTGQSFWMDAALISAAGIPTVVFGPDGGGAHATEEWVDLVSLEQCRRVLCSTIRAYCA